ncbi:MAG: 3-deoxy-D-manno-octulosonic acid transferase, partial [Ramlibacter sp.]
WAQTDADAQRLAQAGARVSGVAGNLKFDAQPDAGQLAQAKAWRAGRKQPVVMFASSREGEEAEFFRLLKQKQAPVHGGRAQGAINAVAPVVQWLVVPRHPQRFDAVAALATQAGFTVGRRSAWTDRPAPAEVWIGDSLGEMTLYYGLADVALLGGSFAPLGGQNLIEAAACGCPVVMGPHTFNFSEAAQLAEAAGAAVRVASLEEGVEQAVTIAAALARREALSAAGLAFAAAHRGAAEKTARAVAALFRG